MHRRKLLAVLGAALMSHRAQASGETLGKQASKSRNKRIVVIGAGLAGLAAARELQRNGHEVVVVEARERIGGRIWTSTHWPRMPMDLGASWIHGTRGNPLTELADAANARRVATYYDNAVIHDASGEVLSAAEERHLEQLGRQLARALRTAQDQADDRSIRQAIEPMLRGIDESSQAHRFIQFILGDEIEHEYAGSAHRVSAHWYDSDKAFRGSDVLFEQGFGTITDFLARPLTIETGQVVEEIQWHRSPVRVLTTRSEWLADQVVVTLPLGVLQARAVRFTPELPRTRQQAIAALGMGVLNKCFLRFEDTFWPANVISCAPSNDVLNLDMVRRRLASKRKRGRPRSASSAASTRTSVSIVCTTSAQ